MLSGPVLFFSLEGVDGTQFQLDRWGKSKLIGSLTSG